MKEEKPDAIDFFKMADYPRYEKFYVQAKFVNWDRKNKTPDAILTKIIGEIGDIEIECQALLAKNEIYTEDFGDDCVKEMTEY